ncbi:MAG: serine/threonine-protein kinase [Acidobacteriota bacterium]
MTPERWRQIETILSTILDQPEQRTAILHGLEPDLRHEVESFLEGESAANAGFLDDGPITIEPIGATIDHYRLDAILGQGGMGTVYRATDLRTEEPVALKIIRYALSDNALLRRFERERDILASLGHTSVARLLDSGTTKTGQPYLIIELIDGTPIDQYAETHRLSVKERIKLIAQVCDAIHIAHRAKIVHRDLKPANILVTVDGMPKIIDFGIASAPHDDSLSARSPAPFTPTYASPEQRRGEPATITSDVYSLGVVLHRLLTGELLEAGKASGLPESIDRIIRRATAEARVERYSSAKVLARHLRWVARRWPVSVL